MSESKIHIKIGIVEFMGEGNPDWVSGQLDKILEKIPELLKIELAAPSNGNGTKSPDKNTVLAKTSNLATFLRDKAATDNQNRKFLATAAFLQMSGKERLTTNDVSSAIKTASQAKLTNPSEALNQNKGKGFCEKDGKNFYVTPEGFKELGLEV